MALPALALAVGLFNAGMSMKSGFDAASRRRRAAVEAARRLRIGHERTLSATTAAGAASGITADSGSLQTYLTTMADEFRRQENLLLKSGIEEADAMRSSAAFGLVGDAAGSLFQFGAANNWFKTPAVR